MKASPSAKQPPVPNSRSAIPDDEAPKWKTVKTFSWDGVSPEVIKALLAAEGVDKKDFPDRLPEVAEKVFGAAGGQNRLKPHAKVLREVWLPNAPEAVLREFALRVQPIVSGVDKWAPINTGKLALEFLLRRPLTKNVRTNLVKVFLRAHKVPRRVPVISKAERMRQTLRKLEGAGAKSLAPWDHQTTARDALTAHIAKRGGQGALVVLPTGSGKTETLVDWLLDRLEEDRTARVLWIVHQQELVDQAIDRFAACASRRAKGSVWRARAIHSAAAEAVTLTEDDLHVAAVTIQTLDGTTKGKSKSRLNKFLKRPT